jgi:serine protease Do
VYIRSRQAAQSSPRSRFRQERQGPDDGNLPFGFPQIPGFGGQGGQGGRRQFQLTPPAFQPHEEASGSGVIVRSNGYILTNDHVVEGADKVTVTLHDGREFVGKVYQDFKSDLALVKIDATNLPAAQLADSDAVKPGEWAIAFGSPFGLSDTLTVGVISAMHRSQEIGSGSDGRYYPSLLQTDASINPGNSGGPLVDVYGRVIGINVAIESPSGVNAGIGFAIPANTARYITEQLISKGSVTRGYMGLAPLTPTYQQMQQYHVKSGALVSQVDDGTPASKAGVQVEDVIVRYNNKAVQTDADFRDMVARTAPGTTVPVVVMRDGHERTLDVTVGSPPGPAPTVTPAATPAAPASHGKLGIQVGNANDPQVRQQLNLKGNISSGAVVVDVLPDSPAALAGIQPGDVIVKIDGEAIANDDQLTTVTRKLKEGETVSAVIRRGTNTVLTQISID